jgi:hypothetical protein
LGGKKTRIFVTFVGDSRLAACASATGIRLHAGLLSRSHEPAASDPAAPTSDFVNVLRLTFISVLPSGNARSSSGFGGVFQLMHDDRGQLFDRDSAGRDNGAASPDSGSTRH